MCWWGVRISQWHSFSYLNDNAYLKRAPWSTVAKSSTDRRVIVPALPLRNIYDTTALRVILGDNKTFFDLYAVCYLALLWRHNDHDGVSNHQPRCCLLNRLFRRRWKKTSKLRVTGLCVGNSPGPVNSPHKGPVTRKMFPFDDVIMRLERH